MIGLRLNNTPVYADKIEIQAMVGFDVCETAIRELYRFIQFVMRGDLITAYLRNILFRCPNGVRSRVVNAEAAKLAGPA